MWIGLAVWTTIFSLTSLAGLLGWSNAVKGLLILNFVLLSFLLKKYRALSVCTLAFCPAILFDIPALAAPCFLCLIPALRKPPFDIMTQMFRLPATLVLIIAAFSAFYAQVTQEQDLLLAPLVAIYFIFTISWAMWARSTSSLVRYFVLCVAWVHMAQGASWAVGAPNWFTWSLSAVPYTMFSALLWFVISLQYQKHTQNFKSSANSPVFV